MVNSIITSLSDTIITPERQAQKLTRLFAARQNRIDSRKRHWLARKYGRTGNILQHDSVAMGILSTEKKSFTLKQLTIYKKQKWAPT